MKNLKIYLLISVISLLIGALLGYSFLKKPVEIITTTKYEKGDTIIEKIPILIPDLKLISYPVDSTAIIEQAINDGIIEKEIIYVPTQVDTANILKDWSAIRTYSKTLFDTDTTGYCVIDAEIQYNRIKDLQYTFTPVVKTITNYVERNSNSFYVGAGGIVGKDYGLYVTAGTFIGKHAGIQLIGTTNKEMALGFNYKF